MEKLKTTQKVAEENKLIKMKEKMKGVSATRQGIIAEREEKE